MRTQSRPGRLWRDVVASQETREISGGFRKTTNNRMEIYAAIAGNDDNPSLLLRAHGQVAVDEARVIRQVIGKQRVQTFDVISPVAMQLAGDARPSSNPPSLPPPKPLEAGC